MFSATASGVSDALSRLLFLNEGHVTSSQRFALHTVTAVYNEEYSYNGDGGNRWLAYNKGLEYLFEQHADNSTATPPSGMRSSVPLGPLGGGTVELRGDGALRDWSIWNNGPYAGTAHQHN